MRQSFPTKFEEPTPARSLTEKLVWILKGFVYPIWSRPYYGEAASKPLSTALVFLLVFALLQSLVSTTSVAVNLNQINREIEQAYLMGDIPEIIIQGGAAAVSGSGRYIIENNRQIIAADTTGGMREINTNLYSEGVLLTRDELHLVNEDGYQVISLSDLNRTFGNPITLDGTSIGGFWSKLSLIINILVLGGGFLFFSLGRFVYLAVLGLLVWGAVSLTNRNFDFAKVLITGIYANVPTTYVMFILRKIGASFFGLRGAILFLIWGLAIAFVLKMDQAGPGPEAQASIPAGY